MARPRPGCFMCRLPVLVQASGRPRSLMAGVTERCEVKSGAGEEAFEETGPVLHPPEPCLDQHGQLSEVALSQAGQGSLEVRPDLLDRVELVRVRGSRQ